MARKGLPFSAVSSLFRTYSWSICYEWEDITPSDTTAAMSRM